MVALFVVLVVSVTTIWFGFLGWGLFELLRSLHSLIETIWSALR